MVAQDDRLKVEAEAEAKAKAVVEIDEAEVVRLSHKTELMEL